jgi:hypothetical protein
MNTRTFLAAGREIKKEARYLGRKTLEHPLKATAGGLDPLCAWAIHMATMRKYKLVPKPANVNKEVTLTAADG